MSEDIKVTDGTLLEVLNNKVDIDGGNYKGSGLEEYVHNHCATSILPNCVTTNNITNCITEIPQRIKLELTDGTLTLKAGSEVIIPNGFEADGTTPKFDYVTVENDLNLTADTYNYQEFVFYNVSSKTLARQNANMVASGSSNVLGQASTYCYCYNTSENKFYTTSNGGTNWSEISISLPICIATKNNSLYASIDQVFNGMGYIGSTIWVDKGVKYLVPNGRNEDGTLKNFEITKRLLSIATYPSSYTGTGSYVLGSNQGLYYGSGWYYDEKTNYNRTATGAIASVLFQNPKVVVNAGKIESFEAKLPLRAVDYNEAVLKHELVEAQTVVETYQNGNSWYRIWSDGWCEQGSILKGTEDATTVSFLKPYKSLPIINAHVYGYYNQGLLTGGATFQYITPRAVSLTGFNIVGSNYGFCWEARGYIK